MGEGIPVREKHHHDGGDFVAAHPEPWGGGQGTVSVCSCGRVVRYEFWHASEMMGGYAWFPVRLPKRWRWRQDLARAGVSWVTGRRRDNANG